MKLLKIAAACGCMALTGCNGSKESGGQSPIDPTDPPVHLPEYNVLEVYIDDTVLPTANHMMKIVSEGNDNKKFVSWSNHSDEASDVLEGYNATLFSEQATLAQAALDELTSSNETLNIIINANIAQSNDVAKFIYELDAVGGYDLRELNLYDTGTTEYLKAYELSLQSEIEQKIELDYGHQKIIDAIANPIGDELEVKASNIYSWHNAFKPTSTNETKVTYIAARSDYFIQDDSAHLLNKHVGNHLVQMDWDAYEKLSDASQSDFSALTGFDTTSIREAFSEEPRDTLLYLAVEEHVAHAERQGGITVGATSPLGHIEELDTEHVIVQKAHMNSDQDFIDKLTKYSNSEINVMNEIPTEVLYMSGIHPTTVAGIGSEAVLIKPTSTKIEFLVHDSEYATPVKDELTKILINMGDITTDHVYNYSDVVDHIFPQDPTYPEHPIHDEPAVPVQPLPPEEKRSRL
ncbi:hypothetical protein VCHA53O466_40225 [Vibrio chagasii]|nr:hypothetical protein VCHA53O466_40225 [Vibrio chagasii]